MFLRRLPVIAPAILLCTALTAVPAHSLGEGSDLEISGPGTEPGKFSEIADITFDASNNLYSLEGFRFDPKSKSLTGNGRVQKFTPDGKPALQISLQDATLGDKNDPQRLAADGAGRVYVTIPKAGRVLIFNPDGQLAHSVNLARAMAITTWKKGAQEKIAVLPSLREVVQGKPNWTGGDHIDIVNPDGTLGTPIPLEKTITEVTDMASDAAGNFYVLAAVNQIYKFSPEGKLLKVIGAAASTRNEDGSELLHSVTVDSKGNIYTMSWGNPGKVTMFDANVTTVLQRQGQFKWADPWSVHSSYVPLAVDNNDRLWAAATRVKAVNDPNIARYHPSPAILRTQLDYLKPGSRGVEQRSALLLGLVPVISTPLPYSIAYDQAPIPVDFTVKPANRQIDKLSVAWRVQDCFAKEIATGKFELPLQNGTEAKTNFSFTPPKLGWYTASCALTYNGKPLVTIGKHFGVTPKYPGMVTLAEGESPGGWTDAPRQMFAGLTNMRLHAKVDQPNKTQEIDNLEKQIVLAEKYKADFFVQFSDKKDCAPENITRYVTRFKGRVKVWEIMNEPNFSMNPEQYAALLKDAYAAVKAADPEAQVMGPTHCGISLPWMEATFKAGAAQYLDIVSVHDYEGHESVDPVHWNWKFGALRDLMKKYGLQDKQLWQTERVITGVRGGNFMPLTQAVRVELHRDLLETLGVPPEHNNHYYLNQGGYAAVPSYLWSNEGPFPGALVLRTRYAMTQGRAYAGQVDFGATGNALLMGLRYEGGDGSTVVLHNTGGPEIPVQFKVTGAPAVEIVDAFGNTTKQPIQNGSLTLGVDQLPLFLRLAPGQKISATPWNLGRNIAARASITYSAPAKNDVSLLNNGIVEVFHAGNPQGGTNGATIWTGDFPNTDGKGSQNIDLTFPAPRSIDALVLRGVRADNGFAALLDYDVQASVNNAWKTVASIRTPMPPTDRVINGATTATSWLGDDNFSLAQFPAVTTDKIRIVALRATHGYAVDETANQALRETWGGSGLPERIMLREIEVYAAPAPVTVDATVVQANKPAAFESDKVTVTAVSKQGQTTATTARISLPSGWSATPQTLALSVPANGKSSDSFELRPPADFPSGQVPVDVALTDADGKTLDIDTLFLNVASPLSIEPLPPGPGAGMSQRLTAKVTNLTAAPLSGILTVQVTGPSAVAPVEQAFGPIPANEAANVEFNVPGLKLSGGNWRAAYTAKANRLITSVSQSLSVREWSVIGSFEKDYDKVFGPEENVGRGMDLTKSYSDMMGNEQKWRVLASGTDGLLNLANALTPNQNATAYAVIYVNSAIARKATFATGTDDCGKAWLNGQLIMDDNGSHGASPNAIQRPVELKAGWNEVVFKIIQGNGGWGAYLDFLGEDNKPIAGLTYSPKPVR